MLKWLCGFAIVASAIVSVAYEQHYTREKYQAQSQADCVALSISVEEKNSCAKEAQGRKDYAPWWNVLMTWPDGITTWAIIATGFMLAWQSSATHKSAKAAFSQIQVMKDTERAKLTIIFPPDRPSIMGMSIADDSGQTLNPLKCFIDIINDGETKAFNVKATGRITIHPVVGKDAKVILEGELQVPKVIRNADIEHPVRVTMDALESLLMIADEDWQTIWNGEARLQIVGTVFYQDVFGDGHNTPFKYVWEVHRGGETEFDEAGWVDRSTDST